MSYANRIVDAVGLRLKQEYPDVPVTSEELENAKKSLPYFFIMVGSGGGKREKNNQYTFRNTIVIDYEVKPELPQKHEHLQDVAENLIVELENITDLGGQHFHAVTDSQKYELFDNFMRFNVEYEYRVYACPTNSPEIAEMMTELEQTTKFGE